MKPIELKIDSFGRILIPQEIRIGLGLGSGSTLKLIEQQGKITLSPVQKEKRNLLTITNHVLVYRGKLESVKALKNWELKIQNERNQKNWSLT
jgi:AbrB family looped-hinge helix DNA binding protein